MPHNRCNNNVNVYFIDIEINHEQLFNKLNSAS